MQPHGYVLYRAVELKEAEDIYPHTACLSSLYVTENL